jgi:hypothetical protein
MTTGENGARQIAEPLRTIMALVTLAFGLRVIVALFDDFVGVAERASDAIWPSHFANGAKAFGVVDQLVDVEHWIVLDRKNSESRHYGIPEQNHNSRCETGPP